MVAKNYPRAGCLRCVWTHWPRPCQIQAHACHRQGTPDLAKVQPNSDHPAHPLHLYDAFSPRRPCTTQPGHQQGRRERVQDRLPVALARVCARHIRETRG
eukprot:6205962-Pleurochrysis_carterae.AAC.1